jgi:hypothetical protein
MVLTDEAAAVPRDLLVDAEGVRPSPIRPAQEFAIGARRIYVFDDLFTDSFVETFGMFLLRQDYQPRPSFDNELSTAIDPELIRALPALPEVAEALVARYHPHMCTSPGNQALSHGYAAAIRYGDSSMVHQDIACDDCVTFLYYGNLTWTGRWGGETMFYDQDILAVAAVSPRPGRVVLFNAAVLHRAGVPTRNCPTFRYAFSMFYRCPRTMNLTFQRDPQ